MTEPFQYRGINHLALVCRDMERTVDFYTNVLGMPLIKTIDLPVGRGSTSSSTAATATRWPSSGSRTLRSRPPACRPRACRPDQGEFTSAIGSMNHVAFDVAPEHIEEYRERLIAAGVPCTEIANHDDSECGISKDVHRRRVRPLGVLPGPRRDPARAGLLDPRSSTGAGDEVAPRSPAAPLSPVE